MRTLAILPIKGFEGSKQRLSPALAAGSRQSLSQAMFADVLAALRRCLLLDGIAVVTDDVVAESLAHGDGAMVLRDHARGGQSDAALIGIRHAESTGFERVLLVPGDTPLVDPLEVDDLLERAWRDRIAVVVVPDRHGTGTNALLLAPPGTIEPSFGPGSFDRHVAAARGSGQPHRAEAIPSLTHDIDTPEDLQELGARIGECRGRAQRTRGALAQFGRSGVRPSISPARPGKALRV
jgi:2-phospho-L-lactate guanylyltransferase